MQLIPLAFKGIGGAVSGAAAASGGTAALLGNIGTGISVVSSIAGGLYQSQVAKQNAQIAEQNALRARQETAVQAQMQDQEAAQQIGAIVAQSSASGLDIGVGSGALRRRSAEELAARDRGFTIYQGEKEAAAYQQQASNFRAEASAARTGGFLSAFAAATDFSFPNLLKDAPKIASSTARRIVRPRRNPIYGV